MEHSKNYEKYKGYYDLGLWDIERIHKAVNKMDNTNTVLIGITEEEYAEITGFIYPNKE